MQPLHNPSRQRGRAGSGSAHAAGIGVTVQTDNVADFWREPAPAPSHSDPHSYTTAMDTTASDRGSPERLNGLWPRSDSYLAATATSLNMHNSDGAPLPERKGPVVRTETDPLMRGRSSRRSNKGGVSYKRMLDRDAVFHQSKGELRLKNPPVCYCCHPSRLCWAGPTCFGSI